MPSSCSACTLSQASFGLVRKRGPSGVPPAIDAQHPPGVSKGLGHHMAMLTQDRLILPCALADELLHGLNAAPFDSHGHRLDRLALQRQHLALHVLLSPPCLLAPLEQGAEFRVGGLQLLPPPA